MSQLYNEDEVNAMTRVAAIDERERIITLLTTKTVRAHQAKVRIYSRERREDSWEPMDPQSLRRHFEHKQ